MGFLLPVIFKDLARYFLFIIRVSTFVIQFLQKMLSLVKWEWQYYRPRNKVNMVIYG
jgi:hypothetical protein